MVIYHPKAKPQFVCVKAVLGWVGSFSELHPKPRAAVSKQGLKSHLEKRHRGPARLVTLGLWKGVPWTADTRQAGRPLACVIAPAGQKYPHAPHPIRSEKSCSLHSADSLGFNQHSLRKRKMSPRDGTSTVGEGSWAFQDQGHRRVGSGRLAVVFLETVPCFRWLTPTTPHPQSPSCPESTSSSVDPATWVTPG